MNTNSIGERPARRGGPVLCLTAVLVLAASPGIKASTVISRNGRAAAGIVVANTASETEKYAASELALGLHQVTGGVFPVLAAADPRKPNLLVGRGAAESSHPGVGWDGVGDEGIVLRSDGQDILLAGGGPRGTLYAVYTFLEDVVGCRWWTAQASYFPWKPTLTVRSLNIRYNPPLECREPFWFAAFDPAWAARNKANGIQACGDESRGGGHVYEGFVHTFYSLIPPDRYFRAHPEWFSEIKGARTHEKAQLCLANEEMRRELVRNLKERLRRNPPATIASVSQNDCLNGCTCPLCRSVEEEEGSPSGPLLRFVNAVAEDIEKDFPGVAIDTLAYQYTRKPPRLVRPRRNVIVRLCSIECSFSRPLDDKRNRAFFEDLEGWARVADRLYVWDYTTNFAHYIQPHPNYQVLGPNIRIFIRNKIRGIFEQGAYQSTCSEMAEMRAWVLAKLLWDPGLDPSKLTREFIRGYYGPAAGPLRDYLGLLQERVKAADDYLGCYSPSEAKFLSLDALARSWRLLEKAEKQARGRREFVRRVRIARLPVAYVVLSRWDSLKEEASGLRMSWPWPRERETLLEWFLGIARMEKASQVSEWQTLEDWAKKGGRGG